MHDACMPRASMARGRLGRCRCLRDMDRSGNDMVRNEHYPLFLQPQVHPQSCMHGFCNAYPSKITRETPSARRLVDNIATTVSVRTAGGSRSQLHSRGNAQLSR